MIGLPLEKLDFSIEGSIMKLQVLLYHTHTHQTMLNPNFNYTFLKSVFDNKGTPISFLFIQVPILYISPESPFPAPGPLKALFSSKCVYFVSPGYMFMWFHPEFDFKNICSSSVHEQSYISFRRCAGVPPLSTEHLAAT